MSDIGPDEQGDVTPEAQLDRFFDDGKLDEGELDALVEGLAEYDGLPPEERAEHRRMFLGEFYRKTVEIEATSGPIPPPTMIANYEKALPGSADRILKMAEDQQAHRHELERTNLQANISSEKRGTWIGGAIALIVVLGSFFLIAIGKSIEGFGTILTGLVMLIGLFTKTQKDGSDELQRKRNQADSNDIREGR